MVNHNWQMNLINNEQTNWERSHSFGTHLPFFYEVRSKLPYLLKQIANLICDDWIWSLRRCSSKQFITGSDELLPRV